MSDNSKNDYQVSTILEHDASADPLETLIKWLESQDNSSLEKSKLLNNPSFRFMNPEGESIKIDDVRNFNRELAFSNYNNERRYFIFFNSDLTTLQAQNASLKSIEEPPKNTQIVLLTSTTEKLLPTILSRCKVVSLKNSSSANKVSGEVKEGALKYKNKHHSNTADVYKKILKSRHYELIKLAGDYKERSEALLFLNKLLSYLHLELNTDASSYEKRFLANHLKIILKTIERLSQNVNVKLVIENCFFDLISN